MKTLATLGTFVNYEQLVKQVNEFAQHFPKLLTQEGSFGKCKFVSYELAMWLRKRNIPAVLIHVQGIKSGSVYPNAHRRYLDKPKPQWSHYLVKVGKYSIDMSARQFDTSLAFPSFSTMHEIRQQWNLVERDVFLNRWMREVLRHKDIA